MKKEIIKKGLIISKTLLFRFLLIQAGGFLRDPGRLLALVDRAVKRVSSYRNVKELAADTEEGIKQLTRMVQAYARGDYQGISRMQIIIVIGVLLYFVTPFDIIPDTIPFLGLLDDISLFAWLISTISTELEHFKAWEKGEL